MAIKYTLLPTSKTYSGEFLSYAANLLLKRLMGMLPFNVFTLCKTSNPYHAGN